MAKVREAEMAANEGATAEAGGICGFAGFRVAVFAISAPWIATFGDR